MARFRYVGESTVDLPTLDLFGLEPGDVIEVGPLTAAALTGHPLFKPGGGAKPGPAAKPGRPKRAARPKPQPQDPKPTGDPAADQADDQTGQQPASKES
jgi:hypothetical protein